MLYLLHGRMEIKEQAQVLHYHIIFVCKYRKKLLVSKQIVDDIKQFLRDMSKALGYYQIYGNQIGERYPDYLQKHFWKERIFSQGILRNGRTDILYAALGMSQKKCYWSGSRDKGLVHHIRRTKIRKPKDNKEI